MSRKQVGRQERLVQGGRTPKMRKMRKFKVCKSEHRAHNLLLEGSSDLHNTLETQWKFYIR